MNISDENIKAACNLLNEIELKGIENMAKLVSVYQLILSEISEGGNEDGINSGLDET